MNKFTAYFISFAALALLVNSIVPVLPQLEVKSATSTLAELVDAIIPGEAHAAQGGPTSFHVGVGDDSGSNGQCNQQFADYGAAVYQSPPGQDSGYVTDSNNKDPNCARIRMEPGNTTLSGGAIYTSDFRIGIALSESENGCTDRRSATSWTGWASEGGGTAYTVAPGSVNAADCIWIYYQTRTAPNPAVRIVDAQAGIAVGNGAMQYTPWATAGNSWSSYSTTSGKDFTSARIVLNSRLNYKYNSDFVSTTIPQYPPNSLTKNLAYTNQQIVMKNIPEPGQSSAMPWISDEEVSSSTNRGVNHCYEWTPASASETCTQTTIYSSTKFKLRRIDNNSSVQIPGGDLTYRRTVVSQWGAELVWEEGQCYPGGNQVMNTDEDKSLANAFGFVKTAHAMPQEPIETCDPPTPTNPPVYNPSFQSQSPTTDVQMNQTATFNIGSLTATQDGEYQLQFKMVKTDTNELFGDENLPGNSNTIARINIRVGNWGLVGCTANQTVVVGENAYYAINASGNLSGPVSVTMASPTPPGPPSPTMTTSPLILDSGNSYSAIAEVPTTGLLAGTYTLNFTGTGGGTGGTASCSSTLTVAGLELSAQTNLAIYAYPDVSFVANGGSTVLTVSPNTVVNLSWTTTATQAGNECYAGGSWSGQKSSTPGTYNWDTPALSSGTYVYTLYCEGFNDYHSATRTVTINVASAPPTPTLGNAGSVCNTISLTLTPGAGTQAGTTYALYDWFDADGSGDSPPATTDTAWQPSIGAITPGTNGPYTPPNSTGMWYFVRATYSGLSTDSAPIGPFAVTPCQAGLDGSDKDIVKIANSTDDGDDCNGAPEKPAVDIVSTGDEVVFRICVINSGTENLSGVEVIELPDYDEFTQNLENIAFRANDGAEYSSTCPGGPSGMTWAFGEDFKTGDACYVFVTATVADPAGSAGNLYRFWNVADITGNSPTGKITKQVRSALVFFSKGGGAPDRNETGP